MDQTNLQLRTNEDWLRDLGEAPSAGALEDLRAILLRGLRATLNGRVDGNVDSISEDFVQEALLKILNSLDTFRGESRFTTWAQKIAIHVALSELRRRRWKDVSLQDYSQTSEGDEFTPSVLTDSRPQPDDEAARQDVLQIVRDLIFAELTERQRQAMLSIVQDGVPLSELAERMDTNPNALYKLLHDARQRLKQRLEEKAGMTAQEVLALFESP
ncbi:MAG: sigma-70 family RNA polymerase sigma factor [Anaerolineales bacterium]